MKKMLALLLVLLMTLSIASAGAQTVAIGGADGPTAVYLSGADESPVITVQGAASVTLKPDYAEMSFGVNTQSEHIADAQAANSQRTTAVLDALLRAGVADDDIHTDGYNVSPIYDYDYGKLSDQQIMKGYEVSNTLRVIVRDLDSVGAVLDQALSAGATQSYGLNYRSDRVAEAYDEALKQAVADAMRKAELVAAASGRALGALRSVAETPDSYTAYGNSREAVAFDGAAGATILIPGDLTVRASVQATYTLE